MYGFQNAYQTSFSGSGANNQSDASSGQQQPPQDAPAAAAGGSNTEVTKAFGSAPKGLPGLPPRQPKGGIPGLPPRQGLGLGGAGLPPRNKPQQQGEKKEDESNEAVGSSAAPSVAAATSGATAPPPVTRPPPGGVISPAGLFGRSTQQQQAVPEPEPENDDPPKVKKIKEKVQAFRVNTFRVALRLKFPVRHHNIKQTMYRLGMAERIHLGLQPNTAQPQPQDELALAEAERAEVLQQPLDYSCGILVLGMKGVGKSATIRRLMGQELMAGYQATEQVGVINGEVNGIKIKFIDTPGLELSPSAMSRNIQRLRAAKRAYDKHKPSCVLYVDRMDNSRRDSSDTHVCKLITQVFGADVWFGTIMALTHAGTPPPDSASGAPMSWEMYVQNRQQQMQQVVRQVAGDQRLLNPSVFVENSPEAPRNQDGESLLPTGSPWRPNLLMYAFMTKVLNDANTLLQPAKSAGAKSARAPFMGMKVPPAGWLLSRLVNFTHPKKLPEDEKSLLLESEIKRLPRQKKHAAYRERREATLRAEREELEPKQDPMLLPEPQLGPTFDPELNSWRYQVYEDPTIFMVRPIVNGDGGVDHQETVETVHLEKHGFIRKPGQKILGAPYMSWFQTTKDKNQFTFQTEHEASYWHKPNTWVSSMGLNVQTIGRDLLYTPRLETRYQTSKKHKVGIGAIGGKLGEDLSLPSFGGGGAYCVGVKLDNRLKIRKRMKLRTAIGRLYTRTGQGSDKGTALAAELKMTNKDRTARLLTGCSAVWQGNRDLTYGGNISYEKTLQDANGTVATNLNLNNKGQGQLVMRANVIGPSAAWAMIYPLGKVMWDKMTNKEEEEEMMF